MNIQTLPIQLENDKNVLYFTSIYQCWDVMNLMLSQCWYNIDLALYQYYYFFYVIFIIFKIKNTTYINAGGIL